jgi:2-polyprenyl-6-methoxyphenol hydroxylase-like FAD-dependent oxidoreductase
MPPLAFHRAQLIRCLFEGLPQQVKSKVLTAKQIVNIENFDNGVSVSCGDGTSYNGSIVIGADGVHSLTRRIMHRITTSNFPGLDWDPVRPFKSEYTCLWFTCPQRAEPGQYIETQSSDRSAIIMTGKEKEWVILFEKHTSQPGDSHKYSPGEVEQFAAGFAELPTSLGQNLGDMFTRRISAGMTGLDEGIVKHWYSGRMVLVGDACHKMTPNAGIGFNSGVQDVVVLCNNLRQLLNESPTSDPSSDAITNAFKEYQSARESAARQDVSFSMHLTRVQAWSNLIYWALAYWVLSHGFVKRLLAHYVCSGYSRGEIISYIPAKDLFSGNVPWHNTMSVINGHPVPS